MKRSRTTDRQSLGISTETDGWHARPDILYIRFPLDGNLIQLGCMVNTEYQCSEELPNPGNIFWTIVMPPLASEISEYSALQAEIFFGVNF